MIRFRSISIVLVMAALAVSARAQGTTGGLLYASDFANWTLPQGNTPTQGSIFYPNQDICKVTSNGYTFLAPKVGRPITIVDGANTETVTPTSVVIGSVGCLISATMAHQHSSYYLKSGTAGAQEAIDYQASQPQGANVILTPTWAQGGGTTGTITGTLKGNAGVSVLDQRTAVITPYVWSGSAYVAQPFASGGAVANQANGVIPLATTATAIGAQSHLDDGVTTPATITSTETIAAPASIVKTSPVADIRAYGAVIDGATDISSPLLSAIASCNAAAGNACNVLLPCGGSGCYLANGSVLGGTPGNVMVRLTLQGTLTAGSTLVLPGFFSIQCQGGAQPSQFHSWGAACKVSPVQAKGSMGTTIAAGVQTFTPTFSTGSIGNIQVNSAISVASMQTCSATASRVSTGALAPNTTYTISTCTDSSGSATGLRIPVGKTISVTGCLDATFNNSGFMVNGQDWPNNTLNVYIAGGSTTTTTGCTIVGFDDNTYETVRISAVSGGVLTANFSHAHNSADLWGAVGMTFGNGTNTHDLQGLQISGAYGMNLWLDNTSIMNFTGLAVAASTYEASGAMEMNGAWWGQMTQPKLTSAFSFNCHQSCGPSSYPYGLRCSQDATRTNGVGCGNMAIDDATIIGGIKIDGNGMTPAGGAGIQLGPFHHLIIEQAAYGGVTVDNRNGFAGELTVTMDQVLMSDDFMGNALYYVAATDCCVSRGQGFIDLGTIPSYSLHNLTNQYWLDGLQVKNVATLGGVNQLIQNPNSLGAQAILSSGTAMSANIRGSGSTLGPQIIPMSTLAVVTAPTCATCSTVTGPGGLANNALEVQSDGSGNQVTLTVGGNLNFNVYKGDYILFGSWVAPGALNYGNSPGSSFGANLYYSLSDFGANVFTPNSGGGFMPMTSDGWQPGVVMATANSGTGGSVTVKLSLNSGRVSGVAGVGNRFWGWFWAYIPGPNNPSYTGVTTAEVTRWTQDLLHGYVPPSFTGGNLAIHPNFKMYWGNDTNLYRASPGVLQTDGTFTAPSITGTSGTFNTIASQEFDQGILAPASSPVTLLYAGYGLEFYGDSNTTGFGVPVGQGFPSLMQADLGNPTLNNFAISGDNWADCAYRVMVNALPTDTHNPIRILTCGTNNSRFNAGTPASYPQAAQQEMASAFFKAATATLQDKFYFTNSTVWTQTSGVWTKEMPWYLFAFAAGGNGTGYCQGDVLTLAATGMQFTINTSPATGGGSASGGVQVNLNSDTLAVGGALATSVVSSPHGCTGTGITINLSTIGQVPVLTATGSGSTTATQNAEVMVATGSGVLTATLTAGPTGVLAVTYPVGPAYGGSFQVLVNGVAATDLITGATTFSEAFGTEITPTNAPNNAQISLPGGQGQTAKTVTITGLTPGTSYTVAISVVSGKVGVAYLTSPHAANNRGNNAPHLALGGVIYERANLQSANVAFWNNLTASTAYTFRSIAGLNLPFVNLNDGLNYSLDLLKNGDTQIGNCIPNPSGIDIHLAYGSCGHTVVAREFEQGLKIIPFPPTPVPLDSRLAYYGGLIEQVSTTTSGALTPGIWFTCAGGSAALGGGTNTNIAPYSLFTSAGVIGDCAGTWQGSAAGTGTPYWRAGVQPHLKVGWAFSFANDVANDRVQIGLLGNGCTLTTLLAVASAGNPACNYVFFRYDTSLSDTVYQLCTDTGSGTPSCTAIGSVAPVTNGTFVFADISFAASNASVTACLNSVLPATAGTCVTTSTKVPSTAFTFSDVYANTTFSTTTSHLRLGPIVGTCQAANCY